MAFQITNSAATTEGIVVWLAGAAGDDPSTVSVASFNARRGPNPNSPVANLQNWRGSWIDADRFALVPGPGATFVPTQGRMIRMELGATGGATQVLPAGSLDAFPQPTAQQLLDRADRVASSVERIEGDASELIAYPLLTSDAGTGGGGGATSLSGAGVRALIDRQVKTMVPNVPRDMNANRLEAAVIRATEPVVDNGITKYVPRKNPYGAADIAIANGGLAGAQASAVVFAQAQLEASLPLLESLEALDVSSDEQVVEADTAILRSSWIAFVNELSREGGPRRARADSLANNLDGRSRTGGPNPVKDKSGKPVNFVDRLGFELGMLKTRKGKPIPNRTDLNVVTVDEEKALSDYLTLRDLIRATTEFWRRQAKQIYAPLALGIGLVKLERLFAVLDESVDEAQAAFDSVFFDDDQRKTQPIGKGRAAMTVADLFEWLSTFASEEGPELVSAGGSRGMVAAHDAARTLNRAVADFQQHIGSTKPGVLRHPRITNALRELRTGLRNIVQATTP